jgi:serine/threonine protein kinase
MLQPNATCFPRYDVLREVAQGVYTTVYEARHKHPKLSERPIALKVLRHRRHAEHFLRMARVNAALDHSHVPSLYEVAETSGQLYMARMFVQGDDLQNGIADASRNALQVVTIIGQVAASLDYAHGRGVVHGLVHPRHILLASDGTAWLIGFGEYPPAEGAALGNPLHLAPEQLEAKGKATPASDVYALAETALWMLSGSHPFARLSGNKLLTTKRAGQLRRCDSGARSAFPPAVEQVLCRGMAVNPLDRFPKPVEFALALATAAQPGEKSKRWWSWS